MIDLTERETYIQKKIINVRKNYRPRQTTTRTERIYAQKLVDRTMNYLNKKPKRKCYVSRPVVNRQMRVHNTLL